MGARIFFIPVLPTIRHLHNVLHSYLPEYGFRTCSFRQFRVPIGGIEGGVIGRTLGGVMPHMVAGHIGGMSKLLEQTACILPLTHLQLHAASAALPAVSSKPPKRTAREVTTSRFSINLTILKPPMHDFSARLTRTWFHLNRILNFNLVHASDIPVTSPTSVKKNVGGGRSKSMLTVPPPNAVYSRASVLALPVRHRLSTSKPAPPALTQVERWPANLPDPDRMPADTHPYPTGIVPEESTSV